MEQREVTIKMVGLSKRTPPELISGISKKIGAAWEKGTNNMLMGLDEVEREVLLPSIIRVNPTSTNWEEAVKDFYSNLTIPIDPYLGKTLIVSTKKKTVQYRGKEIEFDFPDRPMDYIMYKQCLVNRKVSLSENEAKGQGKLYYVEDVHATKIKETGIIELRDIVDREYLKLTEKLADGKFKDVVLVDSVLRASNVDPRFLDDADKIKKLTELRDKDKKEAENGDREKLVFYKTVTDPELKTKGFILACLSYQVFERRGDYIVEADKPEKVIGKDIKSAISFITDAANGSDIMRYKDILKSRRETVLV